MLEHNWIGRCISGVDRSPGSTHRHPILTILVIGLAIGATLLIVGLGGDPHAPSELTDLSPRAEAGVGPPERACPHRLSFVSTRSGRKQIYALSIRNPSTVRQVTDLPGHAFDPTWSPDGRRLAFRWFRQGAVGLYLARADGSDVRLLVAGGVTPSWSPDGRVIAHAAPGGIFLVDVRRARRE